MAMNSTFIPAELQHLLPLDNEMSFLLGVLSLLGTGNEDFVYPEFFEVLSQQNPNDMKPCRDGKKLEGTYPGLVQRQVLQPWTNAETLIAYYPRFDRSGFLHCLSLEQKTKAFAAAARLFRKFFPEQHGETSMYLQWLTCKKYAGHVLALAAHWGNFDSDNETLRVPVDFVYILRHCAGYFREINLRANAISMVDIGLIIMSTQDFSSSQESKSDLELLNADLLSIQASVAIQLGDHATAAVANSLCLELRKAKDAGRYYKTYLLDQTSINLASFGAATGEYEDALDLCNLVIAQARQHGAGSPEARDVEMHAATMAGKIHILLNEFDKADDMLVFASLIFNPTSDSPVFKRAVEQARGTLRYAQGDFVQARDHFTNSMLPLQYGKVMHSGLPDQERTISIYYKLAVIDVQEGKARGAAMKIRLALKMCMGPPYFNVWYGLFHLLWARVLRKFHEFAACSARTEKDFPEDHDREAEKVKTDLESMGCQSATEEQFFQFIPWDLR
ncbi:hypothetical protein UA08_06076 [Talaromyces atroroseus]|uniref:MalT-like TPR region domain-containing protein n=1 Tax=Talaromyces atroroseus TaxID=1441469 RepID=A0A225ATW3_TALAT|nr:hypothetical protein UA08_06076 [Talaromyces atroroseus]OKL58376.1 hypothetical protein UA08_06076 [Talaromyces atroroseus]